MAREGVYVALFLSVFIVSLHQAVGQSNPVPDELKVELRDNVWGQLNMAYAEFSSQNQVSYVARVKSAALFSIAAYDALAVYTESLDGLVMGNSLRAPPEQHTLENKHLAVAYATYRALNLTYGTRATVKFDIAFANLTYDQNNTSEDTTTAIGVGNLVGRKVAESQFNDENPSIMRPRNQRDMRPYVPRNNAYYLRYRTRWQPLEVIIRDETFVQVYYADEMGRKTTITGIHPSTFPCDVPLAIYYPWRPEYKRVGDRVLQISANLNDTSKMLAEGIDGGFGDDGATFLINKYNWNFDYQVMWNFVVAMSSRESLIVSAWYKAYYDTVRPVSMIRSSGLYKDITAWAGPGKGTQTFSARQFRQYNSRTDPSPEHPSGACSYYGTVATVASRFLGTNEFGWSRTFPPGSSRIEQGTPKASVKFDFPTFDSLKQAAMDGREAGLVHFDFAVIGGVKLGEAVGAEVHKKLSSLFKNSVLAPAPEPAPGGA